MVINFQTEQELSTSAGSEFLNVVEDDEDASKLGSEAGQADMTMNSTHAPLRPNFKRKLFAYNYQQLPASERAAELERDVSLFYYKFSTDDEFWFLKKYGVLEFTISGYYKNRITRSNQIYFRIIRHTPTATASAKYININ